MRTQIRVGLLALFISVSAFAVDARVAGEASNQFGVQLFKSTTKRTAKGNKFLSPLSAYLALSMAYNGTEGTTQAEMEKALALTGMTRDEANDANRQLIAALTTGRDFDLSVANSLWARNQFVMKDTFLNPVRTNYGARLEMLDFDLPTASKTINDWVKTATHSKIDSIVPDKLDPQLRLVLINATYFEAKWTAPFQNSGTYNEPFKRPDGTRVIVPTMHKAMVGKHLKAREYEAIELPYGKSAEASMIVVVPTDLAAFETALSANQWKYIATQLTAAPAELGTLALPKVEITYESSLVDSLKQLGMVRAFDLKNAEFKPLSDEQVGISDVLQKTYVKVFEEGTIAAAVTSVSVGAASIPQYKFQMKVDRPYLFGIQDKKTGTLLFMGTVQEPEGGKLPPPPKPRP